jgi:hypothetical protein
MFLWAYSVTTSALQRGLTEESCKSISRFYVRIFWEYGGSGRRIVALNQQRYIEFCTKKITKK